MKIVETGHIYLLDSLDGGKPQRLHFVKRSGTNVQEVLRALIERTEYLLAQVPCAETEAAAGCLRAALTLFELQAARRHQRSNNVKAAAYVPADLSNFRTHWLQLRS